MGGLPRLMSTLQLIALVSHVVGEEVTSTGCGHPFLARP